MPHTSHPHHFFLDLYITQHKHLCFTLKYIIKLTVYYTVIMGVQKEKDLRGFALNLVVFSYSLITVRFSHSFRRFEPVKTPYKYAPDSDNYEANSLVR